MKKNLNVQFSFVRVSRFLTFAILTTMFLSGYTFAAPTAINVAASARVGITGVVKDAKGLPLPGVTIKIKGTNSGTSTDMDGKFHLNLPTGKETLVFTFVGFKTKEVAVNGKTTLDVTLADDSQALDEVVVVGYGVQKKTHLTGAVSQMKLDEVADLPTPNIATAIAGRLIGVGVSGGTSRPGSPTTITVRNPVSYFGKDGGSTSPLYVIDDIIQITPGGQPDATLFNSLDPSEIESVSVLKDASAAIYGSRAANGVVLVKTKRGKSGKPSISYSGSYAINDEAYRTKMMSAYEFAQYINIMNGENGNGSNVANPGQNNMFTQDELDHFKTINYDWLEDAWKSSYNTRHTVNVSGGGDAGTYFGNVSYYKQNGNLGGLDFNRWNFRTGSDFNLTKSFKAGVQLSGNNSNQTKTFNKVGGEIEENDYRNLLLTPRYIPAYVDGYPVKLPGTDQFASYHFYEIQKLNNLAKTENRTFSVNLYAEYSVPFIKGLKAKGTYGKNFNNQSGSQIGSKFSLYNFQRTGGNNHIYDQGATPILTSPVTVNNGDRLYYSNLSSNNYQTNFTLSYMRDFGKHSISGLATIEKAEASAHQEDVWRNTPLQTTNGQFNSATGSIDGRTSATESGSLSYIARVNYSYADKYLAEILFRSDASTKFAPENYWGRFYSGSLGWVISKEDWFKSKAVDFLKVRYSFGLLGNDQVPLWGWRQRFTYQNGKGAVFGPGDGTNTTSGLKMEATPNRAATWSDEFKNNLGIDANFLNGRLSATVDGFYNHAWNVLISRANVVPVTVGGSTASENYGTVNNFGYEVSFGWNDKIGSEFKYGVDFRFAWSDNKVVRMNFADNNKFYPWLNSNNRSSDIGQWGLDNLGMFRNQQEIDNYVSEYNITSVYGLTPSQLRPGMLYYRDVRGDLQADGTFAAPDGVINDNDQIRLSRKADSHYSFGFTLKASYKNFSANAVIGGSFGGWSQIDDNSKQIRSDISRAFQSLPANWGNIYDPVINPTGTMPNPNWSDLNSRSSNFWKVSAFRMRMTNFNVAYTIPKKALQHIGVSNARVFLNGINPFNFYNPFSYKAPDTAYDVYPNLRTFSLGVNVTL